MEPLIERREIRASSMLTASAIVTGPAHRSPSDGSRAMFAARCPAFVDLLADAALGGLRRDARSKRSKPLTHTLGR